MVRFEDYLIIQYKRIFKLLPGMLAMIVAVAVLLSVIAYAIVNSDSYNAERQRYKLGVVGETEDEMISLGVQMVETLDESRFMLELVEYNDEQSAREAMRNADISAYIVITEAFSDALDAMTNDEKLTYYATSGQKGISNVMMDEIALIATNIIVYSETGICTLRQLMKEEGFEKSVRSENINDLFMTYIAALVTRTEVVETRELGLSDGLSTPAYYFSGLLLFFVLLLSFCGISFFLAQKNASFKFLSSKGINAYMQIVGEYIPFLTINVICVAIIMGIMGIAIHSGVVSQDIMLEAGLDNLPQHSLALLPVCLMFSALGFLIFEILIGVINKILVAFMLYVGMGYVSGYFYPKTFFPELVQRVGELLPTGVGFTYMGAIITGKNSTVSLLIMIIYTFVFLLCAMLVRKQKIR